jgi:hypothetical protein
MSTASLLPIPGGSLGFPLDFDCRETPSLFVCAFFICHVRALIGTSLAARVGRIQTFSAIGFRGINSSADRSAALPFEFLLLYMGSLRRRAPTSSNVARRRCKSRSLAHLFHVPLTPAAYTLAVSPSHRIFSVGRAIRAPALAGRRRLRGVTLSRLTDSVRCHILVTMRGSALSRPSTLETSSLGCAESPSAGVSL